MIEMKAVLVQPMMDSIHSSLQLMCHDRWDKVIVSQYVEILYTAQRWLEMQILQQLLHEKQHGIINRILEDTKQISCKSALVPFYVDYAVNMYCKWLDILQYTLCSNTMKIFLVQHPMTAIEMLLYTNIKYDSKWIANTYHVARKDVDQYFTEVKSIRL